MTEIDRMEFKKPKLKKYLAPKEKLTLSKNEKEIVGIFNGQFVTVQDWDSMSNLYKSGSFGKGNLSKGQPSYHNIKDDICKVMIQHQFENHVKWHANAMYSHSQKHLGFVQNDFKLSVESVSHLLESSFIDNNDVKQETWESWKEKHKQKHKLISQRVNWPLWREFKSDTPDDKDYKDEIFCSLVNDILQSRQIKVPTNKLSVFEDVIVLKNSFNTLSPDLFLANTNTNVVLEKLPFLPHEYLNLTLEESFFLKSVLGYLKIVDLNLSEMEIPDLWEKFNSVDKNFTERFITYNYYRKKNWIVRSGLKFGGDYLLYKDGPASYHASYVVKVLNRRKKLSWREFIATNRLVETFNKDLLLCHVLPNEGTMEKKSYPTEMSEMSEMSSCSVQEALVRRWFPSKERFTLENIYN